MTDGLASAYTNPDDSPGLLLWRVTHSWQAAQRAALAPLGLTHVQFVLLAALTWRGHTEPAGCTQQQLAGFAHTDPMMTSQVLRVLESRGLVTRAAHPTDGRARLLAVTDPGRETANRAVVVVEDCDRRFFADLGDERRAFTALLRTLADPRR